jgi:hypothetical protein
MVEVKSWVLVGVFMLAGVAPSLVGPAAAQSVASQCAVARGSNSNPPFHWVFSNKCPFPVYWTVQCGVGAARCYGAGAVSVDPGQIETRELPSGNWEIDGPRRQ